jgi:predicted peptidase
LPVWAFHGGKDPAVDPDESGRMIKALKRLDAAEVKLTIYPDAQHNSWERTYNNPEVYAWLLQHRR